MSTSQQTAALFPEWKQEVNRRVAAHLSRKTAAEGETTAPVESRPARASRAAQAAARVAARYANAPSYNEMLTREARAAVHAAEAASKAAQQAHAAFQYVLDGLEAASSAEPDWEPEPIPERHGTPVVVPPPQKLPKRTQIHTEPAVAPAWELEADAQQEEIASYDAPPRYDRPFIMEAEVAEPGESVQPGEFAQPIHANLIEFPREMIATRRARPRRAEGPLAEAESAPQLSIFEVDPAAISIEPAPTTVDSAAEPAWMHPEWSAMTLEALPPTTDLEALPRLMNFEALPPSMTAEAQAPTLNLGAQSSTLAIETQPREAIPRGAILDQLLEEPALKPATAHEIESAPMSRRLLAIVVDCTLISAAMVSAAMLAAPNISELPGLRGLEFGAVVALLAIGVAYHACFMTLSRATPGMRYAGIEINTFSGQTTTRGQRCGRLLALLLSVVPLGLGVMWALFDEGHLTWHDRLSKTYLRKR